MKEIKSVRAEVKELKASAAPLNTTETFVHYDKLIREANRKEKKLSELGGAIQQLNQSQVTKYLFGIQVGNHLRPATSLRELASGRVGARESVDAWQWTHYRAWIFIGALFWNDGQ